ncbi:MAG: hypothetical protein HYT94_03710 [Parcubacteria group bacterium]|nr:hypothetical protein [Parcubacteria group bacterium]
MEVIFFILLILAIIFVPSILLGFIELYMTPENIERRRERRKEEEKERERERRNREESARIEKEQQEYNRQIAKERFILQYRQLRKEIEAMPQYEHWRQAVFQKFGRKCAVCGSTENLEIDHRYLSFYAIIQKFGITDTVQAYECVELWNVNNGAPLCKTHHDQTKSSVYHKEKNSQ